MTNVALPFYGLPSPTVSHDRSDQRSLAIRRAPSVASRSTTTRRHRSNRSHHGGSSYAPQNEFPNFAHTGDVEIIISAGGQEKRYMLHRLILARSSGFFEAGTSEEWTQVQALARGSALAQGQDRGLGRIREEDEGSLIGRGSTSVGAGQRSLWRYELDPETVNDEAPLLTQKVRGQTRYQNRWKLIRCVSLCQLRCLGENKRLDHRQCATSRRRLRMGSSGRSPPCNLP